MGFLSYMLYIQHLDKLPNASITHFRRLNIKWNYLYTILWWQVNTWKLPMIHIHIPNHKVLLTSEVIATDHDILPQNVLKGIGSYKKNEISKNIYLFIGTTL